MPQKSQTAQILDYLRLNRSITPQDALRAFGCFRLASRINELRAKGHDIETRMVSSGQHNARGVPIVHARYVLRRLAKVAA